MKQETYRLLMINKVASVQRVSKMTSPSTKLNEEFKTLIVPHDLLKSISNVPVDPKEIYDSIKAMGRT